jgi:hypothetical protein
VWNKFLVKSWLNRFITYWMSPGIHFVIALTKMKNSLRIVKLKVYNWTVFVVWFAQIVHISIEKLCKPYAHIFFCPDIDFIELFLPFFAVNFFGHWDIPFVSVTNYKVFKKTAKPMKRYLQMSRARLLLGGFTNGCKRAYQTYAFIINFFNKKNLARF